MRDRLIELLDIIIQPGEKTLGDIADHILADGWTRPPCKVGDVLYRLFRCDNGVEIDYLVADQITIKENNIIEVRTHNCFGGHSYFLPQNFGKVVFTNEEEAEKRKEEINNKLKGGD